MQIKLWGEENISLATELMFKRIDNSDYNVEHIVIVPDRFSLLAEKKLLNILPNGILFNVKVTTFSAFTQNLLLQSGVSNEIATAGERLLYIQKAAREQKSKFQYFKKSNINFCYQLLNTISLLSSSRVFPQDLKVQSRPMLEKKLSDIALIYSRYLDLLANKLDPALLFEKVLKQNDFELFLTNKKIYFAQFDSFTSQMYEIIKFLAKQCKEINISFATGQNIANEYIYEKDIQNKIKEISKNLNCKIDVVIGQEYKPMSQQVVLKELYSKASEKTKIQDFCFSYKAFTKRQEVENVAKIIANQISHGQRFSSFAVAVGSLTEYESLVKEIFEQYNLNFYIDSSTNAFQTIFVRTICNFLMISAQSFSQETLLQFFINPIINMVQDCENIVDQILQKQIDCKWKFNKVLNSQDPFCQFLYRFDNIHSLGQIYDLIENFISFILPAFENYLKILEEKGLNKEANIERQTIDIFQQTLQTILNVEGAQTTIDIREFLKELELLLYSKEVSSVPTLVDGIMVGDCTESFFENEKILFVIGGQLLPKVIGDNALLSDNDIKSPIMTKVVQPTSRMINRRNRFALFNLLTDRWKQIHISYLALDEDGKECVVPMFIEQLNNVFGTNSALVEDSYEPLDDIEEQDNSLLHDSDLLIRDLFFKNNKLSSTQLETYFSCPFKHFAKYGLKLKENSSFAFDQKDVGNFCHKAAEKYVAQFVGKEFKSEFGRIDRFIDDNFDKILVELNLKDKLDLIFEKEGLIKFLKFQIKTILNNIELEMSQSCYMPFKLEEKVEQKLFENIIFTGKIDRIDCANDFFRILDYKTGKPQSLIKDLYFGDKLQLFLYADVVQKKLKKQCGGVFYFDCKFEYEEIGHGKSILKGLAENLDENLELFDKSLQEKGKSTILQIALSLSKNKQYTGSAIAKRSLKFYQNYALEVAKNAYKEISQGYIKAKPDEKACERCVFSSICHYQKNLGVRIKNFNEDVFKERKDGSDE